MSLNHSSNISFKEISMLALGFLLIYSLYYLRTNEQVFTQAVIENSDNAVLKAPAEPVVKVETQAQPLSPTVLDQVEIPDWLANKDDFDLSNLTAEDLLQLARLAHQQDHDLFPDNQNTLVYILKAKELGIVSAEMDELLTSVHANLYDQAELAIRNYDAHLLTALTARLKSIDENDSKIPVFTTQIGLIYTLQRLSQEITTYLNQGQLYQSDQKDAVHTLIRAINVDSNYPSISQLKAQTLEQLQAKALRAAQELDFTIADEQIKIMQEVDDKHELTLATQTDILAQKQNRFAYLDQQFYAAINNLNLTRAANMIEELDELEIASNQLSGYQALLTKTKTYGPYEIGDEFNDILPFGNTGPTMVVIPTGTFSMGSQTGPKHQRPRHTVTIDYGFAVAKNEITVQQFQQFVSATNYKSTAELNKRTKVYDEDTGRFKDKYGINWRHDFLGKPASPDLPVIHVSWHDASAYAAWLSSTTGQNYRLLTESEFEYMLSTNNDSRYPWGDGPPTQIWGNFSGARDKFKRSRIKWREGFSDYEDGYWGPAPVGSFIASMHGINDLTGNIMEWVEDCWHDTYTRAPDDGSAWVNRGCENRVIRGGNWASPNVEYQVHHRLKAEMELTDPRIGFRVAKTFNY